MKKEIVPMNSTTIFSTKVRQEKEEEREENREEQ